MTHVSTTNPPGSAESLLPEPDVKASLLPCPFCGEGTYEIAENGKIWTGQGYGKPISVSVRHWCEPIQGQPSRMLERVGKDEASAVAAWNMRANK
jgi:hypothetical protein